MSVDDSKLRYRSAWDIDQLVKTDTHSAPGGDVALISLAGMNLPDFPVFEVQFKPTGSAKWYQAGGNSTNGTLANQFGFYGYLDDGVLYAHTDISGTARYFVWADKVNY